jgi:hypothetical protein
VDAHASALFSSSALITTNEPTVATRGLLPPEKSNNTKHQKKKHTQGYHNGHYKINVLGKGEGG